MNLKNFLPSYFNKFTRVDNPLVTKKELAFNKIINILREFYTPEDEEIIAMVLKAKWGKCHIHRNPTVKKKCTYV